MKRKTIILLLSIPICYLLGSCNPVEESVPIQSSNSSSTTTHVASISLSSTAVTISVGETAKIQVTISPSNASNKAVTFSSSNTAVATVSSDGTVTAKGSGTATITAKTVDQGKTATCQVTVKAKGIAVTSASLSETSITLNEGDSKTLTITIKPDNATEKSVTWTSSNSNIATVSGGKVTAVKEGTCTIIAKVGGKEVSCVVSVSSASSNISVKIDKVGDLQSKLSKYTLSKIKTLKIAGKLNDIDFLYISDNINNLAKIDLSEVEITNIPIKVTWKCDELILPNSLQSLNNAASVNKVVVIGRELRSIEEKAFAGSSIESIVIPSDSKLKTIGPEAFKSCASLKSIFIPQSVKEIPISCFEDCISLSDITFSKNCQLQSINGSYKGKSAMGHYLGGAFAGCFSIKEITIPKSVIKIGSYAFSGCRHLQKVMFEKGSSLQVIGREAFSYNYDLESITIPKSVTELGEYSFKDCPSISEFLFEKPSSIKEIPEFCLYIDHRYDHMYKYKRGRLKKLELPNSVIEIKDDAYLGRDIDTLAFETNSKLEIINQQLQSSIVYLNASECYNIKTIKNIGTLKICLLGTKTPPILYDRTNGVNPINPTTIIKGTILKVPKKSLNTYKGSIWAKCFQSISALEE